MSHIVEVKCAVENLDALVMAAERMGLTVVRDAEPRYYGTGFGGTESKRCELVIQLPGRYDLGVKRQADGSYGWVCDGELLSGSYGAGSPGRKLLGENAELLLGQYAAAQTELMLMEAGVSFTRVTRDDGTIEYEVDDAQLDQLQRQVGGLA